MKNKKFSYVLIPVVALVWGLIIYKVYQSWFAEAEFAVVENSAPPPSKSPVLQKTTIELIADYRDPFLGKSYNPQPKPKIAKAPKPVKKKEVKPPQPWPEISFQGIIKNTQSGAKLGLLKIDGKSTICREEQVINEITVQQIFSDSILLSFHKEKRAFSRNNTVAGK